MISFLSLSLVRDNFYNISCELQSVNIFFQALTELFVYNVDKALKLSHSARFHQCDVQAERFIIYHNLIIEVNYLFIICFDASFSSLRTLIFLKSSENHCFLITLFYFVA